MLVCTHYRQTSNLAEINGEIVGLVSGYCIPDLPQDINIYFIWQVAVDERLRGKGVALRMLKNLLEREKHRDFAYIDTTISPSNIASQNLFKSLAKELNAPIQRQKLFDQTLFGKDAHEDEDLYRIGPINTKGE